ncbi:hypothetical protein [uncultured Limosilactobacillus sp.]|uniref:hypothetical protein n=1 Tax=uncultured Limosilactobacillus sp. TaxID=2837629 RepID=UPI0025EC045B|nr:hypothetical protein [uncultured Limosilactobacillus sp.]
MKKISLICAVALAGLSLTACGSNSTKKASSSSKVSSSKVVKHHKKAKRSKKKASSSSSSSAVSASSQQNQQQQTQASNGQQQASQNNGQLPPASDLSDFVNRYGESPAAYLMDHSGMSQQQALNSVPDTMKSSGEIQSQNLMNNGQ